MPGFQNEIVYADNLDLSGSTVPAAANGLQTDGDMYIGTTTLNAGGTHVNVGKIISPDGSIEVNYSSPDITLQASSTNTPSGNVVVYEDFLGGSGESSIEWFAGSIGWSKTANANSKDFQLGTPDSGHPGTLMLQCNSNDAENGTLISGLIQGTAVGLVLGGGAITYYALIKLSTLSVLNQDYNAYVGIGNLSDGGAEVTNGVYFHYTRTVNSGNWVGKTASGGSYNSVNSSVAASTNYIKLGFTINAAASSVEFFINGTSIGTQTATIPTSQIGFFFQMDNISGVNVKNMTIDLVSFVQTLTTPR